MSPVTRFSEATRNGLGGRAELERAVELEEKMEQFVDSLNETLFCVTFGDLLSRLSVVVDLARQHMEKEGEEESPSTEPLPPVVLQVVKTEYGECSKGCGAAAKDVEVSSSRAKLSDRTNPLTKKEEEKSAVISSRGGGTGTRLHLITDLGPRVNVSARCSLQQLGGGKEHLPGEGKKVSRLLFEAEFETEDDDRDPKKVRLSPILKGEITEKVEEDMGGRVLEDIRVWVDALDLADYDMGDGVRQLREAVSKEGVKSAAVTRIGRDLLRKMERCLHLLRDCDERTKLVEHHKSLDMLIRCQGRRDDTDEVGGFT